MVAATMEVQVAESEKWRHNQWNAIVFNFKKIIINHK